MDPNTLLARILDNETSAMERRNHAETLRKWVNKGGFLPTDTEILTHKAERFLVTTNHDFILTLGATS